MSDVKMTAEEKVAFAVSKLKTVNSTVQDLVKKYSAMLTFQPGVKAAAKDLEEVLKTLES